VVDEVENPNPAPGTNNWYTEDGYGDSYNAASAALSASYGGGSYSNCSDPSQPGVKPILHYLKSLPRPIDPRCEPGHYYLLNNYNPGYFGNGNNAYTDRTQQHAVHHSAVSTPASATPHRANISWKYYGDQWNNYVPIRTSSTTARNRRRPPTSTATSAIRSSTTPRSCRTPGSRRAHPGHGEPVRRHRQRHAARGLRFVKPSGYVDGHPASSKLDLFEGFVKKIVDAGAGNPELWKDTAIFITFDEGGGYYDSGYVQPLDFFGDGTRIPLIVVSPMPKPGHISHEYADHVSILKFIERNWGLPPITYRSRDNFPNPIADPRQSLCAGQLAGDRRPVRGTFLRRNSRLSEDCCDAIWGSNTHHIIHNQLIYHLQPLGAGAQCNEFNFTSRAAPLNRCQRFPPQT
jgi:phospholipase C